MTPIHYECFIRHLLVFYLHNLFLGLMFYAGPPLPSTEFVDFKDAFRVVNKFAESQGVRLTKKRVMKRNDGSLKHVCMACECHSSSAGRKSKKTDCKFLINLNHQKGTSVVKVSTYYATHNHLRRHLCSNGVLKRVVTYGDFTVPMRETLMDRVRLCVPTRAIRRQFYHEFELDFLDRDVFKYAIKQAREIIHGPKAEEANNVVAIMMRHYKKGMCCLRTRAYVVFFVLSTILCLSLHVTHRHCNSRDLYVLHVLLL